jgi:predicted ester cyclase
MSEANKQLAKRWFEEVWNKGRREAIPEILSPDAEIRESGELVKGPEGFYPFFDRMQAAFSDIHVTFQDAIAEGDMVCLRWSCAMKHTGSGLGIPPTQKTLATTGMTMVRVANGRFVAGWQNWDMLGLMQQIKQEPMAPTYLAAKVGKAV